MSEYRCITVFVKKVEGAKVKRGGSQRMKNMHELDKAVKASVK